MLHNLDTEFDEKIQCLLFISLEIIKSFSQFYKFCVAISNLTCTQHCVGKKYLKIVMLILPVCFLSLKMTLYFNHGTASNIIEF